MARFHRVRPSVVLPFAVAALAIAPALVASQAPSPPYPPPYQEGDTPYVQADWSDRIPAHIAVVEGVAQIERDGRLEPAEETTPLLAGDRLRTARGYVEVLFADGSTLDLDNFTNVDLLSDSLVRLENGRIHLTIARGASDLEYRVDAAGTTTWIRSAGEYQIVLADRGLDPDVRVTVLRGLAELTTPFGRTLVRAGSEARATARTEPSVPYAMTAALWGPFDRWVDEQRNYRVGAVSAQYLPAELRYYSGAFDRYGSWEHHGGYGYVWYPHVAADWQPYYDGRWSFFGSFGWTWIGGGRWGWPTHHYGRWGFSNRWYWIPGRHWGPAWVSWANAPGYISWCPLGFDNRPVISITSINVFTSGRRHGWSVVPHHVFSAGFPVRRHAVALRSISASPGSRFVLRSAPPVRPVSARLDAAPLRAPTVGSRGAAVPRSTRSAGAVTFQSESGSPRTAARSRLASPQEVPTRPPASGAIDGARTAYSRSGRTTPAPVESSQTSAIEARRRVLGAPSRTPVDPPRTPSANDAVLERRRAVGVPSRIPAAPDVRPAPSPRPNELRRPAFGTPARVPTVPDAGPGPTSSIEERRRASGAPSRVQRPDAAPSSPFPARQAFGRRIDTPSAAERPPAAPPARIRSAPSAPPPAPARPSRAERAGGDRGSSPAPAPAQPRGQAQRRTGR
jgi:hypothetical protein